MSIHNDNAPYYVKPSLYRSDPFPDTGRTKQESFDAGVEAVLANTKPTQPFTLQEAESRLANLVSQISTINQTIERDRQYSRSESVPEHILNRRKRASRARNILQQEATQIRSLIHTLTEQAAREEKAAQAKNRSESVWRAYLSAEDVLDGIEAAGGSVGVLGQKYRKRSRSEVPLWFREQWQKTHKDGVFVSEPAPTGEPAEPLKATPASLGKMLEQWRSEETKTAPVEQKLVRYQGKRKSSATGK